MAAIRMNLDEHEMSYGIRPEVGKKYVLIEYRTETGYQWYRFSPELSGVGGNVNPNIKLFHGWRGTTNGTAVYARGIHAVTNIVTYKNGNSKITVSEDLCTED